MTTDTGGWEGRELSGGRYRVLARIAEGGMGVVYRAHDRNLGSDVVVKVPRPALLAEPEFAARFVREIRSLVHLSYPHIVKIQDVGEDQGIPFAVMQYLSGGSLRDRQPRAPDGSPRPMSPAGLAGWLDEIAGALDFIHRQGYVHRDVKPDNILFDAHGNAYLTDFSVAKALGGGEGGGQGSAFTRAGVVLGTPQFMAPETILGQGIDGRVDQYALGVTVYKVLSGRYPFEGPTPTAVLMEHVNHPPTPLHQVVPSLPQSLSQAVQRAIGRDPGGRYPDCAAFARAVREAAPPAAGPVLTRTVAVQAVAAGGPVPTVRESAPAPALAPTVAVVAVHEEPPAPVRPAPRPRRRMLVALAGALALVAVGGAVLGWWLLRKPKDRVAIVSPINVDLLAGQSREVGVVVDHADVWAGRVHLQLEGLPKGVTASSVWIDAGKDRAALTLSASQDAPDADKEIRLVAEVEGTSGARDEKAGRIVVRKPSVRLHPPADMTLPRESGQVLEFPVSFDRGGYDGSVRLEFEQLPDGITADPVTVPGGQIRAVLRIRSATGAAPAPGTTAVLRATLGIDRPGDRATVKLR